MTGLETESVPDLRAYAGIDAVVLLPTLNEEKGLPPTLDDLPLEEIRAAGWSVLPLVLDGGSTDGTREVAASMGIPVVTQRSRGKGAAIREGLELLQSLGVRFAVVLDADATYPGSAVQPALELLNHGSDLVVGVRRADRGRPRSVRDLVHRVGNVLLNFAAGQYSRSTYLDLTSGFWAVDVQKACELKLLSDSFGIEAELFLKAHRNGWNASQMPIVYRQRAGSSKLHAVPDGMRILLTIIRFGRESLQASPPTISEAPTILRDLLLTAFINGSQDVVLLCPRGLHGQARVLAERLRSSGLSARIVVQPAPSHSRYLAHHDPRGVLATGVPGTDGSLGGISLRFGPRGRLFHIELAPTPAETMGPVPTVGGYREATARSGAYASRASRGQADLLDPLRSMGRRLNTDPIAQRRALLAANGIQVIDPPEVKVERIPDGRVVTNPHSF
ncbi:MAG: glycosyltransferase family 2 protein [Thermoplasmata archaeon]